MNEIFERTSVREYVQKEVPQEDITQLLRAAMQAPSAMNQHPWEFIVVKDKKGCFTAWGICPSGNFSTSPEYIKNMKLPRH